MSQSRPADLLGVRFNPFLQSRLWIEPSEMTLSVLSALARLDLDPWREAASLAKLSREAAADRLALMLRRLPGAAACEDLETLSRRSVALLPAGDDAAAASSSAKSPKAAAKGWRPIRFALLAAWLVALGLMAGQVLVHPAGQAQVSQDGPQPAQTARLIPAPAR